MKLSKKKLIQVFGLQLLIYAVLVTIYLFIILRYLSDWLVMLYEENLVAYAFIALVFIVLQAVFLDWLTTFLMNRIGLEYLE
ncbi:MAG: hypothetical protein R3293_06405 [Candidatus Promineifilaceae bacterium]|nr:hypothetical protein [Candidatus Promineifilaceae bacterium]